MPRDTRTYITVHDGMPDHPKVESLDDAAFRALITLWCWCSRNQTDGFVKQGSWDRKVPLAIASQLLEAGLAHAVDGGYQMHDYTEHQRTAQEIEALKSTRAEAGRRGGLAKASNRVANARANGKQTGSKDVADTDTDTDKRENAPRKRVATRIDPSWIPSTEVRAQMATERPDIDLKLEHAKFIDYFKAKSGRDAAKLDWEATWRNWMRNARAIRPLVAVGGDDWMNR